MNRSLFAAGCASAGLAVVLGAFGAHALRDRLGPQMIAVFETGVRYQMFHALALLGAGLAPVRAEGSRTLFVAGGALFVVGTLFFSGSLYLLTLTGARWLGAITPLGGLSFLCGWACLLVGALRREPSGRA